jgi:hypothetical protein
VPRSRILTVFEETGIGGTGDGISISESSVGPGKSPQAKLGAGVDVGISICVETGVSIGDDVVTTVALSVGRDAEKTMFPAFDGPNCTSTGVDRLHEARATHRMPMMDK